jgi:hypothetical protein
MTALLEFREESCESLIDMFWIWGEEELVKESLRCALDFFRKGVHNQSELR